MARLFKSSLILFLSAFLFVAEGFHLTHSSSSKSDDHGDDDTSVGFVGKMKGLVTVKHDDNADGGSNGDNGGDGNSGDGCNCGDAQFRDFMNKLGVIYRNYASKELIPELKAMASKLIDFTLSYLAKEKPDEVSKFHGFIQDTAKVTGKAITKSGGYVSE